MRLGAALVIIAAPILAVSEWVNVLKSEKRNPLGAMVLTLVAGAVIYAIVSGWS